jgi:hypothetical protein
LGTKPRISPPWTTAAQLKICPPTATAIPVTKTAGESAISRAKHSSSARWKST